MLFVDETGLVGTWKLASWVSEDIETGERRTLFGERPTGCMIFTPANRVVAILTGDGRKIPASDDDRVGAFGSMVAYSGKYRVDGNRITTKVDVAWDQGQVGTEQVRYFRIEADSLIVETAPFVSPKFGGRVVRAFLTWVRET